MEHVVLYLLVFILGVIAGVIVKAYFGNPHNDEEWDDDGWHDEKEAMMVRKRDANKQ